jgi:hypothetical protein
MNNNTPCGIRAVEGMFIEVPKTIEMAIYCLLKIASYLGISS